MTRDYTSNAVKFRLKFRGVAVFIAPTYAIAISSISKMSVEPAGIPGWEKRP